MDDLNFVLELIGLLVAFIGGVLTIKHSRSGGKWHLAYPRLWKAYIILIVIIGVLFYLLIIIS